VDLVLPVPALPPRGGDVIAGDARFVVGGGYYVLSAAVEAGMWAAYAGRHGRGPMSDRVRAALAAIGVEALLPPESDGDTGVCVTLVEPDGERTFVTHPGVEASLDAATLAALEVHADDVVYVSGYDLAYPVSGPAIATWIATCLPESAGLVLDPGPLVVDIPATVLAPALQRCTLLTLNRREALLLTGQDDAVEVAAALGDRLASAALLVVRDGARGAAVTGAGLGEEVRTVPADPVKVIDTTGAGDVHTGTLIAALAAGLDPAAAVGRANIAAAGLVAGRR